MVMRSLLQKIRRIQKVGQHWKTLYSCFCGNTCILFESNVVGKKTLSCGCHHRKRMKEVKTTHGLAHTPVYNVWCTMKARCSNLNSTRYEDYGGRGIRVCERWLSFENFYADMGDRPSAKHSIDRINNDGNYEPSNCRWATPLQQRHNQRKSA
jgi:hypothetical protein